MPATSADNSILATGRPVRIPTPDDPSGFPNYYRNFRLTTLAGRIPLSANFVRLSRLPGFHGFIATEAEVPSVFASRYGMTFLRHLSRGGQSVGDTFDTLRREGSLFPLNLLYTCFADRDFRLADGRLMTGSSGSTGADQ